MIVLTGKSASGKSSIANVLIEKYGFEKFVTHTTRAPRYGEINHIDYHFDTVEEFLLKKSRGEFIETVLYNDNYYGTAFEDLDDNKVVILDVNGANHFSELDNEFIQNDTVFFFLECSELIAMDRMRVRKDNEEDIAKRIKSDKILFDKAKMNRIDYIINTDVYTVDDCTAEILKLYNQFLGKELTKGE